MGVESGGTEGTCPPPPSVKNLGGGDVPPDSRMKWPLNLVSFSNFRLFWG